MNKMVEIFREDFETGTTTMETQLDNGEVEISSVTPIAGVYSARCRASFVPNVWTFGRLVHIISPAPLPQVVVEASIRLDEYSRGQNRLLHIFGVRGMLFAFGCQYASREMNLGVYGVGFVSIPRYMNLGEVYRIRVQLKSSSASGVADGAVIVWLNNELIYENRAVDNSGYGLINSIAAGCNSAWIATSPVTYAEAWVDDVMVADTLAPPAFYTLAVDSSPVTGVNFSLNGITKTTPYSEGLAEGSYTVSMPSQVTVNGQVYNFVQWQDGDTNPTRTVNLTVGTAITATYELAPTHTLSVDSTPIQGVPFTIEEVVV